MAKYHILLVRTDARSKWTVEFGSYYKGEVYVEEEHLARSNKYTKDNRKVVTLSDSSPEYIDTYVRVINIIENKGE